MALSCFCQVLQLHFLTCQLLLALLPILSFWMCSFYYLIIIIHADVLETGLEPWTELWLTSLACLNVHLSMRHYAQVRGGRKSKAQESGLKGIILLWKKRAGPFSPSSSFLLRLAGRLLPSALWSLRSHQIRAFFLMSFSHRMFTARAGSGTTAGTISSCVHPVPTLVRCRRQ